MTYDNNGLESIVEIANHLKKIRSTAYRQYETLVGNILENKITDPVSIEHIMDGLLDFCDEDRFIELYRKLCRHSYRKYPQLVGEHIALFRAQFESNNEEQEERVTDHEHFPENTSDPTIHRASEAGEIPSN